MKIMLVNGLQVAFPQKDLRGKEQVVSTTPTSSSHLEQPAWNVG